MAQSSQEPAFLVSDAELLPFVEHALRTTGFPACRLTHVDRKLYDYYSSFAIEELTATFADGTQHQFIFKNLSPDALLNGAGDVRPPFVYDPAREIMVYRDILAGAGLGTATCYAALADPDRQRYWLLLEKVSGDEAYKIAGFSVWCEIAGWLAGMHDRLAAAAQEHQHDPWLLKYDETFCNIWVDRAERFATDRTTDFQPAHEEHTAGFQSVEANSAVHQSTQQAEWNVHPQQMRWLADCARVAVRHLCRLPTTIIHGELYVQNILVQQRENGTRICPVDWETAAIGPGLIDLTALIAGNWTEEEKQQMADAYYSEMSSPEDTVGTPQDFASALRCCRLLTAIKWLGWSPHWQPPPKHRYDWLAEALHLAQSIEALEP